MTLQKKARGWQADDVIEFQGRRKLTLSTYKINGALVSVATVFKHSGDGILTHAFSYGGGGDYSERVIVTPGGRATEKTVTAQHARALADHLTAILERARVHYARHPVRADDL